MVRQQATGYSSLVVSLPSCSSDAVAKLAVWCDTCTTANGGTIQNSLIATAGLQGASSDGGTVVLVLKKGIKLPKSGEASQEPLRKQAGSSRRLLAACSGPLTVGTTSTTFDNCESLTPSLTLYYSLVASGSGTLFKAGLKAASSGYAAFAFSPDGSGRMIGADAAIVYPDSASATGASITGITMTSYLENVLNSEKGTYPLSDTSAAKNADGTLVATFTVQFKQAPNALTSSPLTYLYVTNGRMSGNNLGTHITQNSQYGADVLTLKAGTIATPTATSTPTIPSATTAPVITTPAPVATTAPVTTTAPVVTAAPVATTAPVIPPFGGGDGGEGGFTRPGGPGDGNNDNTGGNTATILPPASFTPSTNSPTSGASACGVTVANEVQTYNACYDARVGSNFKVYFTLEPHPLDAKSSLLSMAMSAQSSGDISVGFPSRAGSMTNAAAAILKVCSTCTNGANNAEYYMKGTRVSDVYLANTMNMSDFKASYANGLLTGSFKVKLFGTPATARRRLLATTAFSASSFPLIYAAGPVSSSGSLLAHTSSNGAGGDLNLLQGVPGAGGGATVDASITQSNTAQIAHMWISTIAWGVLIPLAILMARGFKSYTKFWFNIHRWVTVLGYILALIGLGLGFEANNGWETNKPVHRNLGIACTALGFLQMFSLINKIRPAADHKLRPYWFFLHSWLGRSATILGIANIYYGILNVSELSTWAWATYTGILGAIVLVGIVMELANWRLRRKSAPSEPTKADFIEASSRNDSFQKFQEIELGQPTGSLRKY